MAEMQARTGKVVSHTLWAPSEHCSTEVKIYPGEQCYAGGSALSVPEFRK